MIDPDKTTVQDEISYDNVKQHGITATQEFIRLLEAGESVKMAEMLATRKAPSLGINDQTYQKNKTGGLLEQFDGSQVLLNAWNAEYKRCTGEDIPKDAVIFRGLANRPGDPEAVLTHKHSLHDVKQAMKKRGVKVEGDWEIEPESRPPVVQTTRMAPDLVDKFVNEYIAEDPALAATDRRELQEMVIEKHSRKVTQNDLEPCGTNDLKTLAKRLFEREGKRIDTSGGGGSKPTGGRNKKPAIAS